MAKSTTTKQTAPAAAPVAAAPETPPTPAPVESVAPTTAPTAPADPFALFEVTDIPAVANQRAERSDELKFPWDNMTAGGKGFKATIAYFKGRVATMRGGKPEQVNHTYIKDKVRANFAKWQKRDEKARGDLAILMWNDNAVETGGPGVAVTLRKAEPKAPATEAPASAPAPATA
jgi:hypothetical protein